VDESSRVWLIKELSSDGGFSRQQFAGNAGNHRHLQAIRSPPPFLRHTGQVLSREQIHSHVRGYDPDPGSNVVDVYVRALRKKLGADCIGTVHGMGYRLS